MTPAGAAMKSRTMCTLVLILTGAVCGPDLFRPSSAAAAGGVPDEETYRRFMPGTTITLKPRKQFYFLGENILLDYQVSYDGDGYLGVGSTDGLGVPDFAVVATDTAGKQAPASTRLPDRGGSGGRSLRRGASEKFMLPLSYHCRMDRPGLYRIRAAHDLGWSKEGLATGRFSPIPKDDPRWAEAFIEVRVPSPAEARKVVESMRRLNKDIDEVRHHGSWHADDYADFAGLRYKVYLPILEELVTDRKGDDRALLGITHNPTPEATAALFRLLKGADGDRVRKITAALCYRLPDPPGVNRPDRRIPIELEYADLDFHQRRQHDDPNLVKDSLGSEFVGPMRQFARKKLAEDDAVAVQCAAYILEAIGTRDDLPDLVATANRLVPVVERAKPPEHSWETAPIRKACIDTTYAIAALAARGVDPAADPQTPGEIIHFVLSAKQRADFRPEGWEKRLRSWVRNGTPFLREFVLLNAPRPLPDVLLDPFRETARKVIATTQERTVIHPAVRCALELKIPVDEILALLVERLDEDEARLYVDLANCLADLLRTGRHDIDYCIGCMPTPNKKERSAVKAGWKQFLQSQGRAIRDGRRFELDDPGVSRLGYPFLSEGR
jgi:hypothetical protein